MIYEFTIRFLYYSFHFRYVQFDEYVGFVRAMDEFRGMKLVRKYVDKTQAINIGVTFDTTKHLSEAQIQRRERVRKHIIAKAKAEEEDVEKKKKLELLKLEEQRFDFLSFYCVNLLQKYSIQRFLSNNRR